MRPTDDHGLNVDYDHPSEEEDMVTFTPWSFRSMGFHNHVFHRFRNAAEDVGGYLSVYVVARRRLDHSSRKQGGYVR